MTLMEYAIAMNNDYCECNIAIDKCKTFMEATRREFEINKKEAALKVLKENGTQDDYIYLVEEADEGRGARLKKAIKKIIDSVIEFIKKIQQKLSDLFTSVKTKKTLESVKSAVKKNPSLGDAKVKYQDTDDAMKELDGLTGFLRKKMAKIKSKKGLDERDRNEIDEIPSKRAKIVAGVAIGTVTVATALTLLAAVHGRNELASMSADMESWREFDDTVKQNDNDTYTDDDTIEICQNAADVVKDKARIEALKHTSLLAGLQYTIQVISGKVSSKDINKTNKKKAQKVQKSLENDMNKKANPKTFIGRRAVSNEMEQSFAPRGGLEIESVNDIYDLPMFHIIQENTKPEEDDTVVESANDEGLDLDQYFNDLCDSVVKESAKPEEDYSKTYMKQMEAELFGEKRPGDDYVEESVHPELDDDTDSNSDDLLSIMADLF